MLKVNMMSRRNNLELFLLALNGNTICGNIIIISLVKVDNNNNSNNKKYKQIKYHKLTIKQTT